MVVTTEVVTPCSETCALYLLWPWPLARAKPQLPNTPRGHLASCLSWAVARAVVDIPRKYFVALLFK